MEFNLKEYLETYRHGDSGYGFESADEDGDEVNTLLKLNIECMYYNIDDMHTLTKECAGYMYTAIH